MVTIRAVAAPRKLKPKRESARRRSHALRIYNARGRGPNKNLNPNANQEDDHRTRAAFTMQAVAAPTKIETQTQIRPKTVASCRIHNASGGGPNKIETQTQLSPKTVEHASHSQCKRWRPQQSSNLNANPPEDGRTRSALTMQAVAAPTTFKPERESARRRSHTRRIDNASGGGPNKNETQTRISPKVLVRALHAQCKRWRPQQK